jgi:putative ABC transport system permease protein
MSMSIAARLAGRELRGGVRGFRILIACLALGVAAIAGVGSVRSAIEAGLAQEGAAILGGDAEMSFTYRFAEPEERAWMEETALAVSETADFRSMAVAGEGDDAERGLTQVKAVDGAYPLIGTVRLSPEMPLAEAFAGAEGLPGAVMAPLLVDRLGIAPGDRVRLGTQDFILMARLEHEPDAGAGGLSLGPRTIVLREDLAESGLLAPGSLFDSDYRLDLPEGADLAALEADAESRFAESGLRWRDARNGAPGIREFVDRLGAFLILVGLSGLAVGGVGVAASVRGYLAEKTSVIATLRTLGAERSTIFATYFFQIGALALIGIVLGLILGAVTPMVLAPLLASALPIPAVFGLYPEPLAEAAVYGVLTALVFTLWPLSRAGEVRAAALFRDAMEGGRVLPPLPYLAATLVLASASGSG